MPSSQRSTLAQCWRLFQRETFGLSTFSRLAPLITHSRSGVIGGSHFGMLIGRSPTTQLALYTSGFNSHFFPRDVWYLSSLGPHDQSQLDHDRQVCPWSHPSSRAPIKSVTTSPRILRLYRVLPPPPTLTHPVSAMPIAFNDYLVLSKPVVGFYRGVRSVTYDATILSCDSDEILIVAVVIAFTPNVHLLSSDTVARVRGVVFTGGDDARKMVIDANFGGISPHYGGFSGPTDVIFNITGTVYRKTFYPTKTLILEVDKSRAVKAFVA